ncbi:cell division protein FtsQ [Clostridium botulinum CFSAN001627]|uniref:Cell division protein FtsQ n=1 Tax=Clostridium botulinum CFSAN001627 TaxID=1232189 RepID=M1ZQC2_CLOBO|nr:cell division protein FtsQ [Clostridium botulinum CFSAN001627]
MRKNRYIRPNRKKLNTAINILKRDELKKAKKGYVDVSYEGNPVFYIEK